MEVNRTGAATDVLKHDNRVPLAASLDGGRQSPPGCPDRPRVDPPALKHRRRHMSRSNGMRPDLCESWPRVPLYGGFRHRALTMDMFIHEQNLLIFRKQLAETSHETKRCQLIKLLTEEEGKKLRPRPKKSKPCSLTAALGLQCILDYDRRNCRGAARLRKILIWRVHCARRIGQQYAQQRTMDLEMSVVVYKAQFSELIHEMAHA